MSTITHSEQRINFRLDKTKKQVIERAAAIKGLSVTDFAITVLYREATEVVKSEEALTLTDRERDAFLAALDHPPRPAGKLLAAAARYRTAKAHGRLH